MTLLILTQLQGVEKVHLGNVSFLPLCYRRRFQIPGVVGNALRELHRHDPITVVSSQSVLEDGLGALAFKKDSGVPVVGQIHFELFAPIAQKENLGKFPWSWILKRLVFRALPEYSALRPVGLTTKQNLLKLAAPSQRIHLSPVAVPMLEIPAPEVEREHKVLFVGRLASQKRLDVWLKVAAEVAKQDPEVIFEIAGEGELKDTLTRQARSLGLDRLRFSGLVAYDKLPALYASAKVFLLTSSYEGLPRVVVEAQHFDLPVVASRISGVDEIVEDESTGYLHASEDVQAMAESILLLLRNEEKRREMGRNGSVRVDDIFNPRKLIKEWVNIMVNTGTEAAQSPSCILSPKRPTYKRWKSLSSMKFTLLRTLQYEAIQGLRLDGKVLDIGGGERSGYYGLLDIRGTVESVNIDPTMRSTYIADLNHPLDLPSDSYDTVISLNTWEHICNDELAIKEAFRVLKPSGKFHFVIPFLYQAHGSPHDYHRHTSTWWRDYLVSLGLKEKNFIVEPLVWDPMSSAHSVNGFSRRGWLRKLVMLKPLFSR
ncbi:MAG: glycosyltransferase, partial [Fibrobacteria bacterium]